MKYFFCKQESSWDCSLACIYMLINYYHKCSFSYFQLLQKHKYFQDLNLNQMQNLANQYGVFLTAYWVKWNDFLKEKILQPIICQVKDHNQFHFLIIYKRHKNSFLIADPNSNDLQWINIADLITIYTGIVVTTKKTIWLTSEIKFSQLKSLFSQKMVLKISLLFFISILTTGFVLLNQFLLKVIIDEVLIQKISETTNVLLLAFALFFLQKLFLSSVFAYLMKKIEIKFKKTWNLKFLARLNDLKYWEYKKYGLSLILKKYHHFNEILHFYFPLSFQTIEALFMTLISFFLIIIIDSQLLLPILLLMVLTTFVYALLIPWYRKQNHHYLDYEKQWQEQFLMFIKNQPSYHARNLLSLEKNKLITVFDKQFFLHKKEHLFWLLQNFINQIFTFLITFLTLFLLLKNYHSNLLQPGTFLFLFALINNIVAKTENFLQHFLYWQRIKILKKTVNAFLFPLISDQKKSTVLTEKIQEITLINFNYSYDQNNFLWLKSLNKTLKKKTVFFGSSGSGKTTFFHLLQKNFLDYQGKIFINKLNLQNLKESFYQNQIYALNANTPLVAGTVFNHITAYQNQKKILLLWKKYEINSFLNWIQLTPGSKISDGTVSNGQRQILNFLTLFFRSETLFLLDECLNSINKEWRMALLAALLQSQPKKFIFYASHHQEIANLFEEQIVLKTAYEN